MLFMAHTLIFPFSVSVHFRAHMMASMLMLVLLLQQRTSSAGTAAGLCRGFQYYASVDSTCRQLWSFFLSMHRPLTVLQWLMRDAMNGVPFPESCASTDPVHTCFVSLSALQLASCAVVSTVLYYREYVARLAWLQCCGEDSAEYGQQAANHHKLLLGWAAAVLVLMLCIAAGFVGWH